MQEVLVVRTRAAPEDAFDDELPRLREFADVVLVDELTGEAAQPVLDITPEAHATRLAPVFDDIPHRVLPTHNGYRAEQSAAVSEAEERSKRSRQAVIESLQPEVQTAWFGRL